MIMGFRVTRMIGPGRGLLTLEIVRFMMVSGDHRTMMAVIVHVLGVIVRRRVRAGQRGRIAAADRQQSRWR